MKKQDDKNKEIKKRISSNKKSSKGKKIMSKMGSSYSDETKKMIIIIAIIVVIMGIVYFASSLLSGEVKLTDDKKETTIQYEEILAGSTFNQTDKSYYVIYYDFNGKNASDYANVISKYTAKEDSLNIYKVDLSKKFNRNYITEYESNDHPTNNSEIRVKDGTLIKIENNAVTEYKETLDSIKEYFN